MSLVTKKFRAVCDCSTSGHIIGVELNTIPYKSKFILLKKIYKDIWIGLWLLSAIAIGNIKV